MLIMQRPDIEIRSQEGNLGVFTVSPLEPGFGQTLGNSIRRTLLSSIPGAAVTTVKFEDALHEFDAITGVKEDVTDIILNIKDIVVTSDATEAIVGTIDVTGPGTVTAGDIKISPEIEIINKDHVLAHLTEKGRLVCEVAVDRGKGYVSATSSKKNSVGEVPIDAIFSPVRRVAISVSPTRVEQATNYDELTLEIETDGSLTPREALSSAGETLGTLLQLLANLEDEPLGLTLGEVAPVMSGLSDLDLPIEELDLTERPRNCLKRARIDTIGQLVQRTEDELLSLTNFGNKSLDEIYEKLDDRGLSLRVQG